MVTIVPEALKKLTDDEDIGYGSDESFGRMEEKVQKPSMEILTSLNHTLVEDFLSPADAEGILNTPFTRDLPVDAHILRCSVKEGSVDGESRFSRWQSKKIRNKFRARKTVWRDILRVDCFSFKSTSLQKNQCKMNLEDNNLTLENATDLISASINDDGSAEVKSPVESPDFRFESKPPAFGFDFEAVEPAWKLNRKLRPASAKKFPHIRLQMKTKLNLWEIGKTFRKRIHACLRSAEKKAEKETETKCEAEATIPKTNKERRKDAEPRDNNNNNSNDDSNLINFVVDAQTISDELPIDLASMLIDLQSRDWTPEDYELLLMLDDSSGKICLSESDVEVLPVGVVTLDDDAAASEDRNRGKIQTKDGEVEERCDSSGKSQTNLENESQENPTRRRDGSRFEVMKATSTIISTTTITRTTAVISTSSGGGDITCTLESTNLEEFFGARALKSDVCSPSEATADRPDLEGSPDVEKVSIDEKKVLDLVCAICQEHFEVGQKKLILPCSHFFHHGCGVRWLTESSRNCPLDGLEVSTQT